MGDLDARALGERVRQTRKRRGVTQDELGQQVGLDRTAINKLETGVRKIAAIELSDIAQALGVRMAAFFEDPAPAVVAHRSSEGLDTAQSQIDSLLQDVASEVELTQTLGALSVSTPGERWAVPASSKEAERMAEEARRLMAIKPSEPIRDLARRVEQLGLLVFAKELGPDTADAGMVRVGNAAVALLNSSMKVGRRRLAVAHELAHCLVRDPYVIDWRLSEDDVATESQFDRFARALLLPASELEQAWRRETERHGVRAAAVIIASRFQVDMATLARRLTDLNVVDATVAGEVRSVRTTRADLVEYDLHVDDELAGDAQPQVYQQAVLKLLREDRISSERGLQLLWDLWSEEDLPEPRMLDENEIWQFTS